jgi:hypothetical protein
MDKSVLHIAATVALDKELVSPVSSDENLT